MQTPEVTQEQPQHDDSSLIQNLGLSPTDPATTMTQDGAAVAAAALEDESKIDIKADSNFRVSFRRNNEKRKHLKGSKQASDLLMWIQFNAMQAEPEVEAEEEAPRRRRRNAAAKKAAQIAAEAPAGLPARVEMCFVDDEGNVAVDFYDKLHETESFILEVDQLSSKNEVIERFTFENARAVRQPRRVAFSRDMNSHEGPEGRRLHLVVNFEEMTRTSLKSADDGEE